MPALVRSVDALLRRLELGNSVTFADVFEFKSTPSSGVVYIG